MEGEVMLLEENSEGLSLGIVHDEVQDLVVLWVLVVPHRLCAQFPPITHRELHKWVHLERQTTSNLLTLHFSNHLLHLHDLSEDNPVLQYDDTDAVQFSLQSIPLLLSKHATWMLYMHKQLCKDSLAEELKWKQNSRFHVVPHSCGESRWKKGSPC